MNMNMIFIYFILAVIVLYIILLAYMKIKFSFWSIQPVFHFYNLLDWFRPNNIILKDLPEMNRYVNILDITTCDINDMTDTYRKLHRSNCTVVINTSLAEYVMITGLCGSPILSCRGRQTRERFAAGA